MKTDVIVTERAGSDGCPWNAANRGLLMPERHSVNDTVAFSRVVTEQLGVEFVREDISPMLEAFLPRPA